MCIKFFTKTNLKPNISLGAKALESQVLFDPCSEYKLYVSMMLERLNP